MNNRLAATTFGAFVAFTAPFSARTDAHASGAPFCIAQSGPNGEASYVGNCVYASYQQCVMAATGTRGDCVGNVEYRGGTERSMLKLDARRPR